MNLYDRHLLREWLAILGLVLCATVGLLLVQVLYDDFRDLRELGARGLDLWMYLFVTVPMYLALVLPLALLVSLMFVLGKLHRANEFTALRAAGVSLLRITAPVWIVGMFACGLSWWLNTTVVPWSVDESAALRDTMRFRKESNLMPPDRVSAVYSVGFDNPRADRMWFFNRYSKWTQKAYGVTVSIMDEHRRELQRIVAEQAWFEAERGWTFRNGRELTFRPDTGELESTVPFTERVEAQFREDPKLMLLIDRKPTDLSLPQLRRLIDYYAIEENPKGTPYAVRYFGLVADTLAPLIVIAIAIPFAVTGVRVNAAIGVSKSIGLFMLYYIFSNIASALAAKQLVDPMTAAWVPNIGMALVAGWFFVRLR
ncbi:LptF/LptG family permease [Opitutus terrae]|uniref:Permease YjgP/YjgQ family protein n=1 Tax=Opitutus terrae (strain DSM 11246 / JCM 15787 / PB90-1) TaxID=452637 RepID=B1ZYR8_OPITP|nr:LptF/LptG family permease [Opitutus terrae]ACB75304.1 permease YjgP/YjgQ family protein [Opitutus terrae PB90-1]